MKSVISVRQRNWSRLARMSWDEIAVRTRQSLSKRLDLALHRLGIGPRVPRLLPRVATASFFYERYELQERASLLREHLPDEADTIIREADEICSHRFRLLGFGTRDFGPKIDWHFTSQPHRLAPWFRINFLDFEALGDHKLVWELNRHQHLVTLAKAWLLTGNSGYVTELVNQWYSWRKANPYPLGVNWASSLEVAFRSLSWLWIQHLVEGCPALPDCFARDLLDALQLHGRHVERYLSTYFSPNTHLLGEATALFFLGTLCPQISGAKRWQERGWTILLQESKRQVLDDGVYFEQALYYHVYALDFFLHARVLAHRNGLVIPEAFDEILRKMLYVIHRLSASGPIECFGDDDGGRVFNPRRNRAEHMTDPLALGAVLYQRDEYAAASFTEESIWLFGENAVRSFTKARVSRETTSSVFASSGIYLINDRFPCEQQMRIDAGPQGTGNSGHGHADALSISFSVADRRVLVDPGTCCYVSKERDRDHFRGTSAHNTLAVDRLDQAIPEAPFVWSSIPQVTAETWLNGGTFDYFVGSHDGYSRLPQAVIHRRCVFHAKGGLWIVRDVADGQGEHFLECAWHFSPGLKLSETCGQITVCFPMSDGGSKNPALAFLIDRNSQWKTEAGEDFVSPAYGMKQSAPVVRTHIQTNLPANLATLLVPMPQNLNLGTFEGLDERSTGGVRGYRYQTCETTELFFFAQAYSRWMCGSWASDSEFIYCKLERECLTHIVMIRGTAAKWQGKNFIQNPSRTEVLEWPEVPTSPSEFSPVGDPSENSGNIEAVDSVR